MKRNGNCSSKRRALLWISSMALACALVIGGMSIGGMDNRIADAIAEPAQVTAAEPVSDPSPAVYVAQKNANSVVGVITNTQSWNRSTGEVEETMYSQCSGVVIQEGGYVLTNYHVVSGGDSFQVLLPSGEKAEATLAGSDSSLDLAVLQVTGDAAKQLVPATIGSSADLIGGSTVIAIGNPGGMSLQGSVTYGMVSAVNREIRTSNSTLVCIQTDAAINPGNSGGALVNQYGQIVGINSAKIALEGYEGIGFAIASNHAQPVIDELIKYGRVTGRIQLGITANLINSTYAMQNGVRPGMYIVEIKNQDIIDGGAQVGDIITHIDGVEVESFNGVSEQLAKYKEGDKVTLTIYRPATETTMAKTFDIEIRLIQDKAE